MTRTTSAFAFLFSIAGMALAGCGGTGSGPTGAGDLSMSGSLPDLAPLPPDLKPPGEAISAPKNKWTWVPVAGNVCDDGTPTGIGVYLTDSPNLLVFLMGGGACWDYTTCVQLNTSTHGPYGQAQFDSQTKYLGDTSDSLFNEQDGALFKGWNKVFIPYCTGDIHGGNAVQTYKGNGNPATIHHVGYTNVGNALARVGATIPTPAKLVFSGSSAGGYGAAINYPQARATWPRAKSYLIDDSGPVFVDSGITDFLKKGWVASWKLEDTFFKACPDCADGDWSLAYSMLSKTWPDDRQALLETEADKTISSYLFLSADNFKSDLYQLASMRFDPTKNLKYFIQTGPTHTMLGDLSKHTTNGVNVADWLKQMTTDDPAWASVKP